MEEEGVPALLKGKLNEGRIMVTTVPSSCVVVVDAFDSMADMLPVATPPEFFTNEPLLNNSDGDGDDDDDSAAGAGVDIATPPIKNRSSSVFDGSANIDWT